MDLLVILPAIAITIVAAGRKATAAQAQSGSQELARGLIQGVSYTKLWLLLVRDGALRNYGGPDQLVTATLKTARRTDVMRQSDVKVIIA